MHPVTKLLLANRYDEAKELFISTCTKNRLGHVAARALAMAINEELTIAHRSSAAQPIDLG